MSGSVRARRFMGAIFALILAYAMAKCVLSVVLTDMIDEFSLLGSRQGLMSSMLSVGAMVALVSMFLLQGKVKKIPMVLLSGCGIVVMLLLIGCNRSFTLLLGCLLLQGVGMGYLDAYVNALAADVGGERSGRNLNLLHVFFGLGGLLTPFVVQWVLGVTGWRAAYFVAAGVLALMLGLFLMEGRSFARSVPPQPELRFSGRDAGRFVRDRRNQLLILCMLLYCAFQNGLATWVVRYVSVTLASPQIGPAALACYWVGTISCRLLSARGKGDPVRRLAVGAAVAGGAHLLGVLSQTGWAVCLTTLVAGLAGGHCVPTLMNAASRNNPGRTALATSSLNLMNFLSGAAMPLWMGKIGGMASLHQSMLLPGALALLASVSAYFLWKQLRRPAH